MNKTLFFIIGVLSLGHSVYSELDVRFGKLKLYVDVITGFDFTFFDTLSNKSGDTLHIQYCRRDIRMPNGWSANCCDENMCFLDTSKDFTVLPNKTKYFTNHIFFTNDPLDSAVIRIIIRSKSNPADSVGQNLIGVTIKNTAIEDASFASKHIHLQQFKIECGPGTSRFSLPINSNYGSAEWMISTCNGMSVAKNKIANTSGNGVVFIPLQGSTLCSGRYVFTIRQGNIAYNKIITIAR